MARITLNSFRPTDGAPFPKDEGVRVFGGLIGRFLERLGLATRLTHNGTEVWATKNALLAHMFKVVGEEGSLQKDQLKKLFDDAVKPTDVGGLSLTNLIDRVSDAHRRNNKSN